LPRRTGAPLSAAGSELGHVVGSTAWFGYILTSLLTT